MTRFRIQTHGRLHEWVAEDEGFFADEGLDYEFVDNRQMNDQVVQAPLATDGQHRRGAFETMAEGNGCTVGSACHWAVNEAAATSPRKMWGHAYSMTPAGVYVAVESTVRRPSELAGVPIAVGYHSGSHFSALASLQQVLADEQIELVFKGGPQDRLAGLLDGSLAAANLFGNPMYVAEQLGYRKVLDTSFMIGFIVEDEADPSDLQKYFNALRRAQRAIDAAPERYKHYFLKELPTEYHDRVDVNGFGLGERIVFEPYTRDLFDRTREWMAQNRLFDDAEARGYDAAVLA